MLTLFYRLFYFNEMKPFESASNSQNERSVNHKFRFTPARDSRKRKVRGLWIRNGRYYLQMRVEGEKSARKIPLESRNLETAVKEIREKQAAKDNGELPTAGLKPKFAEYCKSYLDFFETVKNSGKRPRTVERERTSLVRWVAALGHVRVDKITKPMLAAFIDARLKDGLSPRSINVDVIALRNVLKKAANDGFLNALPTAGLKPMKVRTVKRPLLTPAQFEKLCAIARACSKNGDELVDYLKFLAFTGARCSEALRVKWADVDFDRRHVTIGADGLSKNGKARVVDFNANLETHLRDMWQRRAPDTSWLFPSPQRGDKDIAARSLRDSFEVAREKAGLEWAGFHDLRHYFCSMSIMSGIDVRTIAEWMGHLDGGILIGKIYSHLLGEHRQRMAAKLVFSPVVVQPQEARA
jgi:integrase